MQIDTAHTALIVVDALISSEEDSVYAPAEDEAEFNANLLRVVDAARAANVPVIFSNDDHIEGLDRELELWGAHGVRGKVMNLPELHAGEGPRDFIIKKRRYSGFFQTDLGLTLNELGVKNLVVIGSDTNICVLHTLADAFYRNFTTVVVTDATRTFLCGTQEAALEHFVKCFGSTLVTTDEIVAALS